MTISRRFGWFGTVEPTVAAGLEVGDLWQDTSGNPIVVKLCTSIDPVTFTVNINEKLLSLSVMVDSPKNSECRYVIRAGSLPNDLSVQKLMVSLHNTPEVGDSLTVTASNGVSTMTVTIPNTETSGSTTDNAFIYDASAQNLSVELTTTDGKDIGCCSIILIYYVLLV